jgi:hypothetical protein
MRGNRGFLRKIVVENPVEGPPEAKKLAMGKNGKPTFEILTMYLSGNKQLPLTKVDFAKVIATAARFIETLPKGQLYPEWNWASWNKNHRGHIAVASEEQAILVTALINSRSVPGVAFHLWRASKVVELTSVKVKLDGGFLQDCTTEEVLEGLFRRNPLEGTYHEAESSIVGMHQHLVHFKADPTLKASLAKLQTGRSSTFYLTLGGELREATMARDPLVVAAEAAAGMKVRVERALAKAIASSRPGLCPADAAVATSDGSLVHPEQQQQQQHGNKITGKINKLKPNLNISYDPGTPPQEADFLRMYQEMAERRKQLEQEQQHQQQQQQRLEQHQRDQLQKFEKDRQLVGATNPAAPASGHQPLH